MISFKIFLLLTSIASLQCKQFHELLKEEERMDFFQSNIVPEYEVIPVLHRVHKRSTISDYSVVFLKAFGKNLTLYLNPSDGVLLGKNTKVWGAEPDNYGGVKYKYITNFQKSNFQLYQDVTNKAAMTVNKDDDGKVSITGVLGTYHVLKPVPARLQRHFRGQIRQTRNTFTDDENENYYRNDNRTVFHVVYKNPEINYNEVDKSHRLKREFSRTERALPNVKTVYPEILIYVDNALFSKLGRNVQVTKEYVATFWNAVDLRYRLLNNPYVRINIAGIILPLGNAELPFIKKSLKSSNRIDADDVLVNIGTYLLKQETFKYTIDYDIFMSMTGYNMCNLEGNEYNCEALGYAYVAAACNILKTPQPMAEAVGMIEDNGGFQGLIPAAHELGHLLGVGHDTRNKECSSENGYLMNEKVSYSTNGHEWSPCSTRNFTLYLNNPQSSCLRNKPKLTGAMHPALPGMSQSLKQQCQKFSTGSKPCNRDATVCIALQCKLPNSECTRVAPAAEGSFCGHDSICLNGKCITNRKTNDSGNNNNNNNNNGYNKGSNNNNNDGYIKGSNNNKNNGYINRSNNNKNNGYINGSNNNKNNGYINGSNKNKNIRQNCNNNNGQNFIIVNGGFYLCKNGYKNMYNVYNGYNRHNVYNNGYK